jgi:hypothetical protein
LTGEKTINTFRQQKWVSQWLGATGDRALTEIPPLPMVSMDHCAHELHTQLVKATKRGVGHIVITSPELHRALSARSELNNECWDAMESAMLPVDIVIDKVTVRYLLPRP